MINRFTHGGVDKKQHNATEADPSNRFGQLFHLIGDAVVEIELVDRTPVVRTVNPAFEELFGYDQESVLGKSLNEFIIPDEHDGQADRFDERTAEGKENHAIVRRQTATGVREFLYRGVPYEQEDGRRFGFAIYSDVTEQRTYERHIQVIHRILRHNLRNDLSVILGAANQIGEITDDERLGELSVMIERHARTLGSIGEETRTLEKILTADQQTVPMDLSTVCRRVADAASEGWPGATVHTELSQGLVVDAIPELETAIEALVENGIVHNTAEPEVWLVGKQTDDGIVLEIQDDGPGIPRNELTPLHNTEITQLKHGSGLGLWLARCAVHRCDGQIEYERTSDDRTILRLLLEPAK